MKKPFRNLFAIISKIKAWIGSNYHRLRKWNGNNILIYLYKSNDLKTVEGWSPPRVRNPCFSAINTRQQIVPKGLSVFLCLPSPPWSPLYILAFTEHIFTILDINQKNLRDIVYFISSIASINTLLTNSDSFIFKLLALA